MSAKKCVLPGAIFSNNLQQSSYYNKKIWHDLVSLSWQQGITKIYIWQILLKECECENANVEQGQRRKRRESEVFYSYPITQRDYELFCFTSEQQHAKVTLSSPFVVSTPNVTFTCWYIRWFVNLGMGLTRKIILNTFSFMIIIIVITTVSREIVVVMSFLMSTRDDNGNDEGTTNRLLRQKEKATGIILIKFWTILKLNFMKHKSILLTLLYNRDNSYNKVCKIKGMVNVVCESEGKGCAQALVVLFFSITK